MNLETILSNTVSVISMAPYVVILVCLLWIVGRIVKIRAGKIDSSIDKWSFIYLCSILVAAVLTFAIPWIAKYVASDSPAMTALAFSSYSVSFLLLLAYVMFIARELQISLLGLHKKADKKIATLVFVIAISTIGIFPLNSLATLITNIYYTVSPQSTSVSGEDLSSLTAAQ